MLAHVCPTVRWYKNRPYLAPWTGSDTHTQPTCIWTRTARLAALWWTSESPGALGPSEDSANPPRRHSPHNRAQGHPRGRHLQTEVRVNQERLASIASAIAIQTSFKSSQLYSGWSMLTLLGWGKLFCLIINPRVIRPQALRKGT